MVAALVKAGTSNCSERRAVHTTSRRLRDAGGEKFLQLCESSPNAIPPEPCQDFEQSRTLCATGDRDPRGVNQRAGLDPARRCGAANGSLDLRLVKRRRDGERIHERRDVTGEIG